MNLFQTIRSGVAKASRSVHVELQCTAHNNAQRKGEPKRKHSASAGPFGETEQDKTGRAASATHLSTRVKHCGPAKPSGQARQHCSARSANKHKDGHKGQRSGQHRKHEKALNNNATDRAAADS